jgi:hypothetical protein
MFTNGKYTKVVPMTSRKEAVESLTDFTDDVGIPETLVMDSVSEFTEPESRGGKENWIFYQNAGSYGCRRKMFILGCGITV